MIMCSVHMCPSTSAPQPYPYHHVGQGDTFELAAATRREDDTDTTIVCVVVSSVVAPLRRRLRVFALIEKKHKPHKGLNMRNVLMLYIHKLPLQFSIIKSSAFECCVACHAINKAQHFQYTHATATFSTHTPDAAGPPPICGDRNDADTVC